MKKTAADEAAQRSDQNAAPCNGEMPKDDEAPRIYAMDRDHIDFPLGEIGGNDARFADPRFLRAFNKVQRMVKNGTPPAILKKLAKNDPLFAEALTVSAAIHAYRKLKT